MSLVSDSERFLSLVLDLLNRPPSSSSSTRPLVAAAAIDDLEEVLDADTLDDEVSIESRVSDALYGGELERVRTRFAIANRLSVNYPLLWEGKHDSLMMNFSLSLSVCVTFFRICDKQSTTGHSSSSVSNDLKRQIAETTIALERELIRTVVSRLAQVLSRTNDLSGAASFSLSVYLAHKKGCQPGHGRPKRKNNKSIIIETDPLLSLSFRFDDHRARKDVPQPITVGIFSSPSVHVGFFFFSFFLSQCSRQRRSRCRHQSRR